MTDKEREFMGYLAEHLDADADNIATATFEEDPGYVYVKTHSGKELIVTVEEA